MELGCEMAQGAIISPSPMPAGELASLDSVWEQSQYEKKLLDLSLEIPW